MTNLDIILAARMIIATPEHWCRHIRKRNDAYCALGAFDAVGVSPEKHPAVEVLESALTEAERAVALQRLKDVFNNSSPAPCSIVAQFNNTHTHAEVIAAFDRAIERCRTVDQLAEAPAKIAELV